VKSAPRSWFSHRDLFSPLHWVAASTESFLWAHAQAIFKQTLLGFQLIEIYVEVVHLGMKMLVAFVEQREFWEIYASYFNL
jgi:hypothetical protein